MKRFVVTEYVHHCCEEAWGEIVTVRIPIEGNHYVPAPAPRCVNLLSAELPQLDQPRIEEES